MSRRMLAIIGLLIAAAVFVGCTISGTDRAEGASTTSLISAAQIGGKTVTLFHCDRTVPGNRYALVPGANGRGLDLVAHFSSFGSPGGVVLYCRPITPSR